MRKVGYAAFGRGTDGASIVEDDNAALGRPVAAHDHGHVQRREAGLHTCPIGNKNRYQVWGFSRKISPRISVPGLFESRLQYYQVECSSIHLGISSDGVSCSEYES